jgi:hypothetical protein
MTGGEIVGTQMNADERRMNADEAMRRFRANPIHRANIPETLHGVYLRLSAFHLRSSAFPALTPARKRK